MKRISFEEFLPILEQVKEDQKSTGLREDYIEGNGQWGVKNRGNRGNRGNMRWYF